MSLGGQGVAVNITGGLPTGGTNGQSLKKASGSDFDATWQDDTVTVLADGKIIVGNGSNVGTAVTPSGDVTMTNAGAFTVAGARGHPLYHGAISMNASGLTPTGNNIVPAMPVLVTGTYKIKMYACIYPTGGSGNTVELRCASGKALLAYHTSNNTTTTLYAAAASIATYDKGSAIAGGDCFVASSANISLTAGDIVTPDISAGATTGVFTFVGGGTMAADAYVVITLEKQ